MQLNNEFAPVLKSSTKMETATASIAMTPHMFQVLSSGIYQHPVRAVIRETSCNAFDTMVEAGTAGEPFDVHLPSILEPYYEVRDYGTGMTHEQVMQLYLTYGASTKRGSNDLIGGLGIGSKSPFAIAQSFTVTSYKDGTVRRYSIYMEEGVPQVTKLTESITSERNGVSVRVAVPIAKIDEFHEEAQRIYTHFPVKPNCNNVLYGMYDRMSVLSEEAGVFKIFSGVNNSNVISTSIVMGNIEYPIDIEAVVDNIDKIVPLYLRKSITHALIYLPIGSVNIAASRESLQLTDATKQTIIDIFSKVAKEIISKFQTKIDGATTLFDAVKEFRAAIGETRRDLTDMMKNLTWGGKSLWDWREEQSESRTRFEIDPTTGSPRLDWHGKPKKEYIYDAVKYCTLNEIARRFDKKIEMRSSNNATTFSIFEEMTPDTLSTSLFVIDDRFQKNGERKAVGRNVILKEIYDKWTESSKKTYGIMYFFESQKEIDDLCNLHHYPSSEVQVFKTSDYNYAYVPKKIIRGQVKLWECINGNYREVKIDLDSLDNPQYYIKVEGSKVVSATLGNTYKDLSDIMSSLSYIVPTKHVFMFRKTVWNKIPEDWIEVDADLLVEQVKQNPVWYIEYNRGVSACCSYGIRPKLDKMNVVVKMDFEGQKRTDGYNYKGTLGVNFEDNLEVFRDMFGRPSIIFADLFYPRSLGTLAQVIELLPENNKLVKRVLNAKTRAERKFKKITSQHTKKNKLLSWVDWSKVTLREVAEHLGYNVTPYINKN